MIIKNKLILLQIIIMAIELQNTIVFFRNLEAFNAKNPDGSRKYKYIINRGSSRSSKTYSLIDLFDYLARTNKNQRYTIWRDTKTDCKKTVLSDMTKHLRISGRYGVGFTFNKTESIFFYHHENNSTTTIEIHGTDDEETVHGLTQNIAWLNEPYKISQETFDQIDMRSDVVFIDYNPKKDHYIEDIAKQDNAIVIHSTYKDNPFCPEQQKIKIESYQPLSYCYLVQSEKESKDFLLKFEHEDDLRDYLTEKEYLPKYIRECVRCYKNERQFSASEYNWTVYGLGMKAENPNKIYHNWIRISRHEYDTIKKERGYRPYYGLDFGFSNPSACVEVMFDGDRTLYVRQLMYKPIKELGEVKFGDYLIQCGVPIGNITYVFSDTQDKLQGVSEHMVNDLRTWHGINAVKSQKPSYTDRFHLLNNVLIVKYTDDSKDFEKEYEGYEYEFINGISTEKPIKVDDHLMNAFEYAAWGIKIKYGIKI